MLLTRTDVKAVPCERCRIIRSFIMFVIMLVLLALVAGDKLAVLSAGAYSAVMASTYNTRPPAGEVLVFDGKAHLLRPARSLESLLAEETIPVFE